MHELTVTESILNIAKKHAQLADATRVTEINVVIGQLSSIVDDSIQFYWDIISEGTLCYGAVLNFQRVPARLSCLECGNEYGIETELEPCPRCKSFKIKVITGEEFWVESIAIEKPEQEISK
jgi:hydrogenase nickel incorporation protein HypA/HybF